MFDIDKLAGSLGGEITIWCSYCRSQEADAGSLTFWLEDEDGCEMHEVDLPICQDCLDYAWAHGKIGDN